MNNSIYVETVKALEDRYGPARGGRWPCPAHDGTNPNLAVREGREGRALITCHSRRCTYEEVREALGLPVRYSYPGGAVVERRPGKSFSQSGDRNDTTLYGSDRISAGDIVIVCEGEKDADVVTDHWAGYTGVSPRQGANTKAARWDWTPLHDRTVLIAADKDDAGRDHARDIYETISGVCDARIVEAAHGKDIADHYKAQLGPDDLVPVRAPGRHLVPVRGDKIQFRPINWMMDDWIPLGFLTLLAGREGLGKSTIACRIAADRTQLGETIIYIASEDSVEHVVAPRLKAAGADMSRVIFLRVSTEFSDDGAVEFPADLPALETLIVDEDVTLIVLDAATSVVSQHAAGDGNNDRRIRSVLEPISAVAARQEVAFLGIAHFGKKESADTGKLLMGSIAWSQVARSVLAVARDEDSGDLVVSNTKSNLAKRTRSDRVSLTTTQVADGIEVGRAEWMGPAEVSAADLLGDPDEREERSEVEQWLSDYLTENPDSPSADVKRECARDTGASGSKIDRAARRLGVVKEGRGMPRRTYWSLPDDVTDATDATGSDQRKHDDATGAQSRHDDATGTQSRHAIYAGHAQSRQSRQLRHCQACGDPLVHDDDQIDGYHTSNARCVDEMNGMKGMSA